MTEHDSTLLLKRCSRCKRWFPAKYPFFNHTKNKKSGLEYHCRGCRYGWTEDEFQVDVLRHALLERGYKQCRDCGEVKPLSEYNHSSSSLGNCRPECKVCSQKYLHELNQRPETKTKRQVYRQREDIKAARQEYYKGAKYKATKSAYDRSPKRRAVKNEYQRSPEFKEQRKQYLQQPEVRERLRVYGVNRRERIHNSPSKFTIQDWRRALEYFDYSCAVCGCRKSKKRTIAADHWIPLKKGGLSSADNIVPLCHSLKGDINGCNNLKNARDPVKWLTERFGKEKATEIMTRIQAYFEWIRKQG